MVVQGEDETGYPEGIGYSRRGKCPRDSHMSLIFLKIWIMISLLSIEL